MAGADRLPFAAQLQSILTALDASDRMSRIAQTEAERRGYRRNYYRLLEGLKLIGQRPLDGSDQVLYTRAMERISV